MKTKTLLFLILSFSVLMFFVNSCSDDEQSFAKVQVINASPDAPAVNVLIDGVKQNPTGLKFPEYTSYINVDPGKHNLQIIEPGLLSPKIDLNMTLDKDNSYSVFTIKEYSQIEPLILLDVFAKKTPGKLGVRFVNVAPDSPPLDVAIKGGPNFPGISFKSATPFNLIDAGVYIIEVNISGSTPIVASLQGVNLEEGKNYTVIIEGFLKPPTGNTNVLGLKLIENQ